MRAQENDLITRTGPGTAGGELLRRFWQPVALLDELTAARPVVPVTIMGERLVLFRDESGRYGLMDRHCPHRGADLCFGRLEDGGLRCPFHGWLFDATGQCLEQPAEPEGSTYYKKLRARAYKCVERSGIVFAYMGPGEPPPFPEFDCFMAPREYTFAFKGLWECNWLQALEVGIDPAHTSYLHRFFEDESPDEAYGKQFRGTAAGEEIPLTRILRESARPRIELEDTAYGFRIVTRRDLRDGREHVRVTNLAFPQAIVIPMGPQMTITQWHVPVDDTHCYWYSIFTSFGDPVDRETMRAQRLQGHSLPEYRPHTNRANGWGFDAEDQRQRTYTGLGADVNVQDQWAVESQGPIHDRTKEHLGKSDVAIIHYRKLLKRAIEAASSNEAVPFVLGEQAASQVRGPVAIDVVAPPGEGDASWKRKDLERRGGTKWARDPGLLEAAAVTR